MTISTTNSFLLLAGTGSQFSFDFNFIADESSDIVASYIDANNNITPLSPTQYTLNINAAAPNQLWGLGGTFTYPLSGSAIAAGTYILLQRILPLTQETSVQNQGNYYAQVTEQALDILEMQIQQVSARTGLYRGVWATDILYNLGDYVIDGINGANTMNYYMCAISNTSGVWATDLAAGDWTIIINVAALDAAVAEAVAAAATATTEAGIATTQAGIATTEANIATSAATTCASAETACIAAESVCTAAATSAAASAATAATYAGINSYNVFNGDGSTTSFTLSSSPSTINNTNVYISGVHQNQSNYSISGTTITFVTAPSSGTANVVVVVSTAITGGGGGSGTVTSVSVVTANGLSGTVANSTTTPAITLSTSVSGLLKGNGTSISAATAGTDYLTPTGNGAGLTNLTAANISSGTAGINISGNAATVTTNANLTGPITSVGNATTITSNAVTTSTIAANAVTNAKMATSTANTLAGYSGAGAFSDVAVGSGLSLSGGTLTATSSGNAVSVVGATSWLNISSDSGSPNTKFNIATNDSGCVMYNGSTYVNPSGSTIIQVDITTSGLGGLDTGALAANTWYYVWRVSDGANINAYISLSYNSPTISGAYQWIARIGLIRTDGSSHLVGFVQYDNNWWYQVGFNLSGYPLLASAANVGSITSPTWSSINTTSIVPPIAHTGVPVAGSINCKLVTQIDGTAIVAPDSNYGAYNSFTNPPTLQASASAGVICANGEIPITQSGTIVWAAASTGSNTSYLFCTGFRLVL